MSEVARTTDSENIEPITILLVGQTGVGKSSTINSLFGTVVAPVGEYEATTKEVVCYRHTHDGVEYAIWDTPGLCDQLPEVGNDQRYLEEMRTKVKKPDCVWFVTKLNETRITSDERRGVKLLTEAFGHELWSNALVVFSRSDECPADKFAERFAKRSALIRDLVDGTIRSAEPAQATVHKTYANSLPSVAVANGDEGQPPRLLPNGKTWIGELFATVLERLDPDAQAVFLASLAKEIGPNPQVASAGARVQSETSGSSASSGAGEPKNDSHGKGPRIGLDEDQQSRVGKIASRIIAGVKNGATLGGKIGASVGGAKGAAIGTWVGAAIGGLAGAFGWL